MTSLDKENKVCHKGVKLPDPFSVMLYELHKLCAVIERLSTFKGAEQCFPAEHQFQ